MARYEQPDWQGSESAELLDIGDCLITAEDEELLLPMFVNCEFEDPAADSVASSDSTTPAKPPRKRTYELRKDEVNELDNQAKQLSAEIDLLKQRAGIPVQQSVAQQKINNLMLREVLRNQQLLAAGFRSLMAADMARTALRCDSEFVVSPISSRLHLEGDLDKRLQLLHGLKQQKLRDAKHFVEKRTQFLPKTTRVSEFTKRELGNGDRVSVRLDIAPLPHGKSVKQVYDALQFYYNNLETCMAEVLSDVTVREESSTWAEKDKSLSIAQHRFLYTSHHQFQVESNSIVFFEYTHKYKNTGEAQEEGIFASDFVNQDDLFPFSPQSRMRKDITCILHVQSCDRPQQQQSTNDSVQVVVLTMWFYTKLHRCDFAIPEERLLELIEDTDRVQEAILKAVRALLQHSSLAQQ